MGRGYSSWIEWDLAFGFSGEKTRLIVTQRHIHDPF